jgi:hypothetical protein
MNGRLVAVCCTVVALIGWSRLSLARTSSEVEAVRSYMGIGRIKWQLPKSFDHYFAVPEFTAGPRIKCKGPNQDCQIIVASLDITVPLEQRRAELSSKVAPLLQQSEEKAGQLRSFGTRPEVVYVTLTDSRPKPGEFRLYTTGFSVNGPAVIKFEHFSNDAREAQNVLDVVQGAKTIDAREVWAWRLNDYKIVCEERYPAYKPANDAAFRSSAFSSVDILRFWQTSFTSMSVEQVQKNLKDGRLYYARTFDNLSVGERQRFCESFPTWVKEAAKDISTR